MKNFFGDSSNTLSNQLEINETPAHWEIGIPAQGIYFWVYILKVSDNSLKVVANWGDFLEILDFLPTEQLQIHTPTLLQLSENEKTRPANKPYVIKYEEEDSQSVNWAIEELVEGIDYSQCKGEQILQYSPLQETLNGVITISIHVMAEIQTLPQLVEYKKHYG